MRLVPSLLVILVVSAASPAIHAQEYVPPRPQAAGVALMEGMQNSGQSSQPQKAASAAVEAQMRSLLANSQAACPVFLTAASVAPVGRVMPVAQWTPGDGSLQLHFQYQSKSPIESVAITAHLKVKTDQYALDAKDLEIPLTFAGTGEVDRPGEHILKFALPPNVYLYGVARVTLDSIIFTTGEVWRPQSAGQCGVNGHGPERVEAK